MWIKFLLLAIIPLVTFILAYWLGCGRFPTQSTYYHNQYAFTNKWRDTRDSVDKAGTALIVYGMTKDKAAIEKYTAASAELSKQSGELETLAGLDNGSVKNATKALQDKMEQFKNEMTSTPKVDLEKLSTASEGWQNAARKLDHAIQMVIINQLVVEPFMGITFGSVIAGVMWGILVLIFSLSCFMRYTAVRHNIGALASGQPLKPQSKFGCWDEISKLDKVVHEVAAAKNAG